MLRCTSALCSRLRFAHHLCVCPAPVFRLLIAAQLPAETSGQAAFDVMLTTYTLFEREGGYKADRAFLLK